MFIKLLIVLLVLGSYGYLISKRIYLLYLAHPIITSIIYLVFMDDFIFELLLTEIMLLFVELLIIFLLKKINKTNNRIKQIDEIRGRMR